MRSNLPVHLGAILCMAASVAIARPTPGPSVRDIVEFPRLAQPDDGNDDALGGQVSPDGTKAFIVVRTADVASDKNRYEIQLLDLNPARLTAQQRPSSVTVFSIAMSRDNNGGAPALQDVTWHGDKTLVFLARLDGDTAQVYRFDLPRRKLTQLTHETHLITSYAVSQDLQRVLYAIRVPNPPLKDGEHQIVVGNQSFWDVKFGQHDLIAQTKIHQFLVADVASGKPPRALGGPSANVNNAEVILSISPDGRWALLPRYEPERLDEWVRQYPVIANYSKEFARSQQVDPLQYFSTPLTYVPRRMTAWRLDDGQEQAVVDAPDSAKPGEDQELADVLWQGNGTSVVLAGTQLPLTTDGRPSLASHIIEYWPDSGRWSIVAKLETHLDDVHALRDGFVVTDGGKRREFHRQTDGGWRESAGATPASPANPSAWTLRIVQGLNQPPDVYAAGPAGQTRRLTALAPQFDAQSWGVMRAYSWRDGAGRQWDGGLMSGNTMDPHKRYPLLIQTYGFSPESFYLDGPNSMVGATSAFAGRAFLQHDILVLALPLRATGATPSIGPEARQAFKDGVRGAIAALVKEGRVDPARVGIVGWSSRGEQVLDLLTFDDLPIRAATVADGDALTLFSLAVTYGFSDVTWGIKEAKAGGLPFGDGLPAWVSHDMALHTDCIHAATRIETYGPWVLNNWDIYALLRRQYKPVEMVVIPDGTHSLWTPGDRMASLQGNVDWYGFWLAGKTRTVPLRVPETAESLSAQFAGWRQMEDLKKADDARPACKR